MLRKLDHTDVRIIAALQALGPRNMTAVAKKLDINPRTLRDRVKRLESHFSLSIFVGPYHTNMGLKKAVVLAESFPGHEKLLFDCLKANDFWIYLGPCYGMFEGCVGVYTIPKDKCSQFEEFLREIEKMGMGQKIECFWSTCFHGVSFTDKWFVSSSHKWIPDWDEWVEEVPIEETKLPYTLVDPDDFPQKADKLDVLIIKELEKDATITFAELAEKFKTSPQRVRYHFENHILKYGLLECFGASLFDRSAPDIIFMLFQFDTKEKLSKFAVSLLDKPFVQIVGKLLDQNALIVFTRLLPLDEFGAFRHQLSKLIKAEFLQCYLYAIVDVKTAQAQTISYEYFDGNTRTWVYDHKRHLTKLQSLADNHHDRT
jgi:DNA-binding Lrp family transcriptional regulator